MSDPTAAARLVSWYARDIWHPGMSYTINDFAADIATVEAQARDKYAEAMAVGEAVIRRDERVAVLRELRKEVAGLPTWTDDYSGHEAFDRAAVLEQIDRHLRAALKENA